jgi:hypothetical protein
MANFRLELSSAYGDQSLSQVRFVVHGSSQEEGKKILREGLPFIEGKAIISTNLKSAYEDAMTDASTEPGMVTVFAMPSNFHIGYAVFTTAYIDRSFKMVLGAPLRYAAARKQLAFYMDEDVESSRKRIEGEAMAGFPVANHPSFTIDARYALGGFLVGSKLKTPISQVEVSAKALEPIDFNRVEATLQGQFEVREAAQSVLVPTMLRDVVVGTVESVILTQMRILRWQGLALLGFRFREGREDVVVATPDDIVEHRRRMEDLGRQLESSSGFVGELAWLKVYIKHQLELMRVELDGAELEAA